MNDDLLNIMQTYQKNQSLEKTAEELRISTSKVRRVLLTLGLWKNSTSERIKEIRVEHPEWENSKIARELNISLKTVQMYTPYNSSSEIKGYDQARHIDCSDPVPITRGDQDQRAIAGKRFRQTPPKMSGRCGDTVWWSFYEDGHLEIIGTGDMWNDFDCSSIRYHIQSILIGDEVTSIGNSAFSYCPVLREVKFGRKVHTIGPRAFYHCAHLVRISIPDEAYETWGNVDIFEGDPIITVHIASTVKQIPSEFLNIPAVMQFVCELAEEECTEGYYSDDGILYFRDISSGIQEIVKCPCSKPLYTYKVQDGTTRICSDCFNSFGERQTLSEVVLPDSITDIDYSAFFGNRVLREIIIPNNVKKIGQAAFYGCSSLEKVRFGTNVEDIGIAAFRLCTALEEVVIPEKVIVIGDEAFARCDKLGGVTFLGDAPRMREHDYYREGIFGRREDGFAIYHKEGKRGWTDPWMGYETYSAKFR